MLEGEDVVEGVVLIGGGRLIAGIEEDAGHPPGFWVSRSVLAADPALAGHRGQVLERHGARPTPLGVFVHHERHLSHVGAGHPLVAADGDQVRAEDGRGGEPLVVVDPGESLCLRRRQRGVGREVALADRLGDSRACRATCRFASWGWIGRTCTGPPPVKTTSASQPRG
jgi:hypothetical protein